MTSSSVRCCRRASGWIAVGVLAVLLWPALAEDKKPAGKDGKSDKQETKDKMVPVGALVCRISRVEGAQKSITVQVSQPTLQRVGRGFRVVPFTKDVELRPSDDMKVRMIQPPADFNEKGRPRKYTEKELKELKGSDPKLPGYSADFDNLKADQVVKVYLSARKDARKSPARGRSKDKEADDTAYEKPEVTMVVILAESKK